METSLQRVERLEGLSKTKQDLISNPTFEHFEVDYYLTDSATVHPNT